MLKIRLKLMLKFSLVILTLWEPREYSQLLSANPFVLNIQSAAIFIYMFEEIF